jgi:hypothetical protein
MIVYNICKHQVQAYWFSEIGLKNAHKIRPDFVVYITGSNFGFLIFFGLQNIAAVQFEFHETE